MTKCPYCAEEIQDDAKKCKHCGEWLEDPNQSLTIKCVFCEKEINIESEKCEYCGGHQPIDIADSSENHQRKVSHEKHPWYIKLFLILGIPLLIALLAYFVLPDELEPKRSRQSSSDSNKPYFTGYAFGEELASRHSYYKGDKFIEYQCDILIMDYMDKSTNRGGDYMFIRGCVNGYKEAFGKR